jgi:molybdopterin-containing oxidoreductase family iron-sulfur binding subunit
MLGGNPVFTAPADAGFAARLSRVPRTIHLGTHLDETSIRCTWHIPQAHYLEAWGDARSFDGTLSLQQPLIAPLYGGKSACEVLGILLRQQPQRSDYELVREHWRSRNRWPDFEAGWRRALHDGLVEGSAMPQKATQLRIRLEQIPAPPAPPASILELAFRPDPSLWDGSFANNGWLQECPRPISKLTWDNAALVSPQLARTHGLSTGDMLQLELAGRTLEAPALITPGQAERTVTLHLGYGRPRAGRVGSGVGFDACRLRDSDALWFASGLQVRKLGRRHQLVATQTHHNLENPERQVYRATTLREFVADPGLVKDISEVPATGHTLYDPDEYPYTGYKWGMSIDLSTCIGCNACLVACETENNIPVVGKREVARHREMFWIRVDTYFRGSPESPEFNHMPVPCMHCEHAPCELVCPVAATVHDHEGLNLQVYNRCVGTRFCSNNCPYKVRRFNFFHYAKYSATDLGPMYNPEVTVRWRGVMEKCTYCLQRINAARIEAEKDNRRVRDGEIKTACQQACPAEAIVFGDLNDPHSRVSRLKKHPLDYLMLGELNTRPRTTYLAKVQNPPPPDNAVTPA